MSARRGAVFNQRGKFNMRLSTLTISAALLALVSGGSALAQATAPVTMQPIPNPPEKATGHASKHHAKHHAKAAKSADTKSDAPAAAPETK
jgi:hypothetical protein